MGPQAALPHQDVCWAKLGPAHTHRLATSNLGVVRAKSDGGRQQLCVGCMAAVAKKRDIAELPVGPAGHAAGVLYLLCRLFNCVHMRAWLEGACTICSCLSRHRGVALQRSCNVLRICTLMGSYLLPLHLVWGVASVILGACWPAWRRSGRCGV